MPATPQNVKFVAKHPILCFAQGRQNRAKVLNYVKKIYIKLVIILISYVLIEVNGLYFYLNMAHAIVWFA